MYKENENGHPDTELRTYNITASCVRRPMGHAAGSDITECSTSLERPLSRKTIFTSFKNLIAKFIQKLCSEFLSKATQLERWLPSRSIFMAIEIIITHSKDWSGKEKLSSLKFCTIDYLRFIFRFFFNPLYFALVCNESKPEQRC